MKTINETFEDKDYDFLLKIKGKHTWREFMLDMANSKIILTEQTKQYLDSIKLCESETYDEVIVRLIKKVKLSSI